MLGKYDTEDLQLPFWLSTITTCDFYQIILCTFV